MARSERRETKEAGEKRYASSHMQLAIRAPRHLTTHPSASVHAHARFRRIGTFLPLPARHETLDAAVLGKPPAERAARSPGEPHPLASVAAAVRVLSKIISPVSPVAAAAAAVSVFQEDQQQHAAISSHKAEFKQKALLSRAPLTRARWLPCASSSLLSRFAGCAI